MATKATTTTTLDIVPMAQGAATYVIRGVQPLICNRLSEKAKRELLLPGGPRRTAASRAQSLKHDPLQEYRDSPYTLREDAPTRLAMLGTMFKGAIRTAALDTPGAYKTQIGRLVHPADNRIPVFGVPQLFMSVVRSADMAHTPDIRTRAILPEWVCLLSLRWMEPIITQTAVSTLLTQAGFSVGVGDWRPEKGAGIYGQFTITDMDDPDVIRLMRDGGRAAQDAALAEPVFHDDETEELYAWYTTEIAKRTSGDIKRVA